MLDAETKAEIRRLYFGEHWKVGTLARHFGVHHTTVKRAIDADSFVSNPKSTSRPSQLDPFVPFMRDELAKNPKLTGTSLHRMLKARGYPGSAIQVRRKIRQLELRPKPRAYLRVHALPAEEIQVDWMHIGDVDIKGFTRRLSALVFVCSYSRAIFAHFAYEQTVGAVLEAHRNAFDYFGGVSRSLLYDNMKTVVIERSGSAIRFNIAFTKMRQHYHFKAKVCPPRCPEQKGKVERAVRYIRDSFVQGRKFNSASHAQREFAAWAKDEACARPCQSDREMSVGEALEVERGLLMPLPQHPYDCCDIREVRARKYPFVTFDMNEYSVPHTLVGETLTLLADSKRIRIVHKGDLVADHPRHWGAREVSENPEHIETLLEMRHAGGEAQGRMRLAREIPGIEQLYQSLIETETPLGRATVRLTALLDTYGPRCMQDALKHALESEQRLTVQRLAKALSELYYSPEDPMPEPTFVAKHHLSTYNVQNHNLEDYDDLF